MSDTLDSDTLSSDPGSIAATPFLHLDRLSKRFGSQRVTADVSFSVGQSEIVALLGPSGSGKTTALRLVAGFEIPDSGRIVVAQEDVTRVPPERRRFGMVFQHYALFPHMTVGENVAFGLETQGVRKPHIPTPLAPALPRPPLPRSPS